MKFDDILIELGEFGKYQKSIYVLIWLTDMMTGCNMLLGVFTMSVPNFRCSETDYPNNTFSILESKVQNKTQLSSGKLYSNTTRDNVSSCTSWVYNISLYERMALIDFGVPAPELAQKRSMMDFVLMSGSLFGATISGILADRIGRKSTYIAFVILLGISGVTGAWIPNIYVFTTCRFLTGFACAAVLLCGRVLAIELLGPSKRGKAVISCNLAFTTGCLVLVGLAYIIRDWRILQTVVSLPAFLSISYVWLIPESCRWLLVNNRPSDAEKILREAARVNNAELPDILFDEHTLGGSTKPIWPSLKEFFNNRVLCGVAFVMFFNWLVVSMIFYGLSLNAGALGENIFLDVFVLSSIEYPGLVFAMVAINRLGRKPTMIMATLLEAISLGSIVIFHIFHGEENTVDWVVLVLAMFGKLGAAAVFGVIYAYTSELVPTVTRNIMVGLSSTCARLGGMLAPVIFTASYSMSGLLSKAFPMIVFTCLALIAALLSLYLPETNGLPLPETVEDAALQMSKRKDNSKGPLIDNVAEYETFK